MPRFPLHSASGTGVYDDLRKKVIRMARYGCANRPFFHIVVMNVWDRRRDPPIEQLGTFDPMANQHNERLVSFNFERIQFWLGQGNVEISKPVAKLLGLSGFLPIHPISFIHAWNQRQLAEREALKKEQAEKESEKAEQSN